jgi:uridine phosphorylase
MIPDAEIPRNAKGRLYHIDCGPGDIAPYVLTCGHPERARKIIRFFDTITVHRRNREFLTFTGSYKGIPASVMSTGIGVDNTAIAIIEAAQCARDLTFIRLGTCGAIQDWIKVGDLVISQKVIRDEKATHYYAPPEVEARAHPGVLAALQKAAATTGMPHHTGLTCTTGDFYAGQGRRVPGFPLLNPDKVEEMRRAGVLSFEMEMSAYLTLAAVSTYNLRAGGACVVVDNPRQAIFKSARELNRAEKQLIQVGVLALEILAAEDGRI